MSHELEMIDGEACMAYAASGGVPWHSLGFGVPDNLTPVEMLKVAKLDWTVSKKTLSFRNGNSRVNLEKMALVRDTDLKVMDVVSKSWQPIQNLEAFEFFNEYVKAGSMTMETAGSLRGGKNVWAMAKIGSGFTLGKQDRVENYLLFSNPHQFGVAAQVMFCSTRAVCSNTLTAALEENVSERVRVMHRKQFDPDAVKVALGLAQKKSDRYQKAAEFLITKQYTQETAVEYLNRIFKTYGVTKEGQEPKQARQAKHAFEILETQPGAEFFPGTWWNALNSVTRIADHEMGRNWDNRLYNSWFGSSRDLKVRALNEAIDFAKAA